MDTLVVDEGVGVFDDVGMSRALEYDQEKQLGCKFFVLLTTLDAVMNWQIFCRFVSGVYVFLS